MAFRPIYESELSPSGRGRSEALSPSQFQEFAQAGHEHLQQLSSGKPGKAFGQVHGVYTAPQDRDIWPRVKHDAYRASREDWGGQTLDPRTGEAVSFTHPDRFAVSVHGPGQEQRSVPHHMSEEQFGMAMDQARKEYGKQLGRSEHFLGVFHDPDVGNVDIDPVHVTGDPSGQHREEVGKLKAAQVAAATHALGGSYQFSTGEGHWPPHVREED